jgi:hypothetical protein
MIYIEIESTGKILPLPKKEKLRVTFQAADFGQAGSTNGSFSTSINLPMSAEVLAALGFSNVLNVTSQLSPYKNIKARLLQDNNEIDKGFIRIDEDDIKSKEITITFLGRNVDWFTSLGDKTLRELDLSEYDHVKNNTTINEERTEGYVYLPVDYGTLKTKNTATITIDEIFPAVFVNTVVKKIFKDAGYKVTGTLFKKQDFNRLLLPFNLENAYNTPEFIDRFTAIVKRDPKASNTLYTYATRIKLEFDVDSGGKTPFLNIDIKDKSDSWNLSTYRYVAQTKLYVLPNFYTRDLSAFNNLTNSIVYPTSIILAKNGVDIQTLTYQRANRYHFFNQILLDEGDYLELYLTFNSFWSSFSYTDCFFEVKPSLTQADTIMTNYLPNLKQSELIEYLFFIFGVIPSFDKNTNSVVLDSITDLTIGTAEVWGDKIDGLQPIEKSYFDFVENYAIRNICTYEEQEDDAELKAYNDTYRENFGNGFFEIDNDYIEAETEYYNAPILPTISRKVFTNVSGLTFYLPYILKDDSATAKILYFAGFQNVEQLTSEVISTITIGSTARTTIPYSYFILPIDETVEDPITFKHLGFSDPKNQLTGALGILDSTYGNLQRILNKPISVTVSLRLSAFDIANVKYNRLKYFEQLGGYYYLNKIGQYDGSGDSTECELIKWY